MRYACFVLMAILCLGACNNNPADDTKSSSSANDTSASSNYAKDKDGWLLVLNDAYAQSVKEQKPILAYFTASDTCRRCAQLDTDVFSTPVFKAWSDKNVVLFKIDNPLQSQGPKGNEDQNAAMARSLKVSTFPTLWVLSVTHEAENGRFKVKPIGYTTYQPSPEKLIGSLQNFIRKR